MRRETLAPFFLTALAPAIGRSPRHARDQQDRPQQMLRAERAKHSGVVHLHLHLLTGPRDEELAPGCWRLPGCSAAAAAVSAACHTSRVSCCATSTSARERMHTAAWQRGRWGHLHRRVGCSCGSRTCGRGITHCQARGGSVSGHSYIIYDARSVSVSGHPFISTSGCRAP